MFGGRWNNKKTTQQVANEELQHEEEFTIREEDEKQYQTASLNQPLSEVPLSEHHQQQANTAESTTTTITEEPQYVFDPDTGAYKRIALDSTTSSSTTPSAATPSAATYKIPFRPRLSFLRPAVRQMTSDFKHVSKNANEEIRHMKEEDLILWCKFACITAPKKFCRSLKSNYIPESIWIVLTLVGTVMSVAAWAIDELTESLIEIRKDIGKLGSVDDEEGRTEMAVWLYQQPPLVSFFLWWVWCLVWGFVAVAVVRYISPQAAGSGIEQVRSIMIGYSIPGYFNIETLIAKVIGLVAQQLSGLTIGKEGPFVHIACSVGNLLVSFKYFEELRTSRALYKQVISAACATGIASAFGSPVGGVLFAIEVTSNVYYTSDYWKAFYTSVVGELAFRELSSIGFARASAISLFPTTFPAQPYELFEIPLFLVLSALCGFFGGWFVKFILGVRTWRSSRLATATAHRTDGKMCANFTNQVFFYILRPWGWAFTVLTLHSLVACLGGKFMMRSLYNGISDFVVSGVMMGEKGHVADPRLHSDDWGEPFGLFFNLFIYWFLKSILFALALSLPVPSGTLIPMLAIGLCMGRFFGEVVQIGAEQVFPGGYALVGASAFLAGATGAISTAVIIFEITAQLTFMVPVLLAVIVGRACGKMISHDLYEALQITKNLPNIPPLNKQNSYSVPAFDLMDPDHLPVLPKTCTREDIQSALNQPSFRHHAERNLDDLFAIVEDVEDLLYIGSISRGQLEELLRIGTVEDSPPSLDLLGLISLNGLTMVCQHTTPLIDILNMFELTLVSTLFVVENCRLIGWIDLEDVKHRIEHGLL